MGRRSSRGGFTLVELAVVVTIVGILSVIAVVGYRRYMLTSKISEAQAMISAIRIAQEDHRAERGTYANLGDSNFCPFNSPNAGVKTQWSSLCSGGVATWNTLPVHANGPVLFGYITTAGTGAFAAPPNTTWVTWGTPAQRPWYTVVAKCDMDGDSSNETMLVGSSFQNSIFSHNEGL